MLSVVDYSVASLAVTLSTRTPAARWKSRLYVTRAHIHADTHTHTYELLAFHVTIHYTKTRIFASHFSVCPFNGVFTLPDSDSYADSETDSDNMQKGYTGTDSNGDSCDDSDAKLLWKLL